MYPGRIERTCSVLAPYVEHGIHEASGQNEMDSYIRNIQLPL